MTTNTYQLTNRILLWALAGWTCVCLLVVIVGFFNGANFAAWEWMERNVFFLSE